MQTKVAKVAHLLSILDSLAHKLDQEIWIFFFLFVLPGDQTGKCAETTSPPQLNKGEFTPDTTSCPLLGGLKASDWNIGAVCAAQNPQASK
jgi:hypothetical protein